MEDLLKHALEDTALSPVPSVQVCEHLLKAAYVLCTVFVNTVDQMAPDDTQALQIRRVVQALTLPYEEEARPGGLSHIRHFSDLGAPLIGINQGLLDIILLLASFLHLCVLRQDTQAPAGELLTVNTERVFLEENS